MKELKKLAKLKLCQFFNNKLKEDEEFSIEMPYEDNLTASNEYTVKVKEVYPEHVRLEIKDVCSEEYTEQCIVKYEDIDIWSVTDAYMYVLRSEFIE